VILDVALGNPLDWRPLTPLEESGARREPPGLAVEGPGLGAPPAVEARYGQLAGDDGERRASATAGKTRDQRVSNDTATTSATAAVKGTVRIEMMRSPRPSE
jgi:hypothetical protein